MVNASVGNKRARGSQTDLTLVRGVEFSVHTKSEKHKNHREKFAGRQLLLPVLANASKHATSYLTYTHPHTHTEARTAHSSVCACRYVCMCEIKCSNYTSYTTAGRQNDYVSRRAKD